MYHTNIITYIYALNPDVTKLAQLKKKLYYSNLTLQSLSTPIWNNIPEHMKSAITVNTFKSMLKKHYFYTY